MAALGTTLISKLVGDSPAEKAFKPWWDNAQNFLVYGLVMLGIIVVPTAIINSTPLDCTRCNGQNCKFVNGTSFGGSPGDDPKFNAWWVKKYCTYNNDHLGVFLMYFPYVLLILALVLVLIERGFVRAFKTGDLLDDFYNLLVKDRDDKPGHELKLDLDGSRHAIEISNRFSKKSNYWVSYVVRTVSELIVAGVLFGSVLALGLPSLFNGEGGVLPCNVYGHMFECSGHPKSFYEIISVLVLVLLAFYIVLAFYNVTWLSFASLGKLSKVMCKYRLYLRNTEGKESLVTNKELLGNLWDIYYNNKDLKLLLNLLAESSGLASALRILALFDDDLRVKMQPSKVKITKSAMPKYISTTDEANDEDSKEYDVKVSFLNAEAVEHIFSDKDAFSHLYTVEISPPTDKCAQVTSIRIGADGKPKKGPSIFAFETTEENYDDIVDIGGQGEPDTVALKLGQNKTPSTRMSVSLDGLSLEQEYVIRVCTVVNGHTIAKKTEVLKAVIKPKESSGEQVEK